MRPAPPRVLWVDETDDEGAALRPGRRWWLVAIGVGGALLLALAAASSAWLLFAPAAPPDVAPPPRLPPAAASQPRDTLGVERRVLPPRSPRAARPRPAPLPSAKPRAPLPPGRLFVGSTPWGDVYVDNRLLGPTPIAGLPIAAGVHRVRVVRDGFQPYDTVIQVPARQDVRLINITLRALAP